MKNRAALTKISEAREKQILTEPYFRRGELLRILNMDRGLFTGWEERGLFKYEGPATHRRFYCVGDYLKLAIAQLATQLEVPPADVWVCLNECPDVIRGNVQYALADPTSWKLVDAESLDQAIRNSLAMQSYVKKVVVLDLHDMLWAALIDLERYLEAPHEDPTDELRVLVRQLIARTGPKVQVIKT